jgi:phosphatidate cytidylyltransferase
MADAAPPAAPKWADLGVRLISAVVLIPAVIADVWAGGIWFNLFVALLGVLMANEWVTICHRQDQRQFALHAAAAIAGALLPLEVGIWGSLAAIAVLGRFLPALPAIRIRPAQNGAILAYPTSACRQLPWCCCGMTRSTGSPPSSGSW